MDTDSCIFKCDRNNPNEYRPALGSLLGNMTDELKAYGAGTFITDFLPGDQNFMPFEPLSLRPARLSSVVRKKVSR